MRSRLLGASPGVASHGAALTLSIHLAVRVRLHTGIAWEHLPQELGFGSGMTCWSRLAEWTEAGVWARAPRGSPRQAPPRERPGLLLSGGRRLPHSCVKGGHQDGTKPRRPGQEGQQAPPDPDVTGVPLAATGGNRNDVTQLIPLLQAVPPVRGKRGAGPGVLLTQCSVTVATTMTSTAVLSGPQGEAIDRPPRHRARLRPGHPAVGRGARVRPPALVPPPTDPLGDSRQHSPGIPRPRMRTHLLAATVRSDEPCRGLVSRCQPAENFHGGESPADQSWPAPVDADLESVPGEIGQFAIAPGIQRHGCDA